jgi:Tail fiber protein gp32
MPSNYSITSANAIFNLTVPGIFAGAIKQFGVDNAFAAEMADTVETEVGVDAYGVAGYRPHEIPMTIRFEAASPSIVVFENWIAAQDLLNDVLYGSAVILMPSIGRKYTCPLGFIFRMSAMAEARRVLGDREFNIHWLPQGPGVPAISPGPM